MKEEIGKNPLTPNGRAFPDVVSAEEFIHPIKFFFPGWVEVAPGIYAPIRSLLDDEPAADVDYLRAVIEGRGSTYKRKPDIMLKRIKRYLAEVGISEEE